MGSHNDTINAAKQQAKTSGWSGWGSNPELGRLKSELARLNAGHALPK